MNSNELDTLHIWVLDQLVALLLQNSATDIEGKAEQRATRETLMYVRNKCDSITADRKNYER